MDRKPLVDLSAGTRRMAARSNDVESYWMTGNSIQRLRKSSTCCSWRCGNCRQIRKKKVELFAFQPVILYPDGVASCGCRGAWQIKAPSSGIKPENPKTHMSALFEVCVSQLWASSQLLLLPSCMRVTRKQNKLKFLWRCCLDQQAHRSLTDSYSDMSYFISGFGLPPPHFSLINTGTGRAHIFLTFSALTLFNRVTW